MKNIIGLRREDLSKKGERRTAIIPALAQKIVEMGYDLNIQPAIHPTTKENKRAFEDDAYLKTGAIVTENLEQANLIFGLKEVEKQNFEQDKAYVFFSHTHKGQVKNRGMLKSLMDCGGTLFDYELVNNAEGARVITAFTFFAGYAGMIDTLWAYGKRLEMRGIDHPFSDIPQSIEKEDLDLIKELIKNAGKTIMEKGTPESMPPFINVILGDGKTSFGAQEIYDLLPVSEITLNELPSIFESGSRKQVYKLVLKINEMFRLKENVPGSVHAEYSVDPIGLYFRKPEYFESNMDQVIPYTSMLMNCILWSPDFPRLLSRDLMGRLWSAGTALEAIGDITCDPEGSIEFSKETWIDSPVYIYSPPKRENMDGFEGEGVAVMAVTNLPCEFSADASRQFSEDMEPILSNILAANFQGKIGDSGLNDAWKGSCILWKGEFTEPFKYMKEYLS